MRRKPEISTNKNQIKFNNKRTDMFSNSRGRKTALQIRRWISCVGGEFLFEIFLSIVVHLIECYKLQKQRELRNEYKQDLYCYVTNA